MFVANVPWPPLVENKSVPFEEMTKQGPLGDFRGMIFMLWAKENCHCERQASKPWHTAPLGRAIQGYQAVVGGEDMKQSGQFPPPSAGTQQQARPHNATGLAA